MNSLLFATMLAFFHATPLFGTEVLRFIFTVVSWEFWLLSPQVIGIIVQKECRGPYLRAFDKIRSRTMDGPTTTLT
ncbi:hypothetical protein Y032_0114g425 [Ancylostoma ceylanicum]|uniref:7TM GPCR serpentine receptor class x (Srx) domain-containing protein n=1 Tax=Ancylostoma ceylanicum TaxID=53326 RepID=A0A016TD32_9BILA|nr:hypothetical protein Y032_0114g425 [Ancylostoma ceylanicum]